MPSVSVPEDLLPREPKISMRPRPQNPGGGQRKEPAANRSTVSAMVLFFFFNIALNVFYALNAPVLF